MQFPMELSSSQVRTQLSVYILYAVCNVCYKVNCRRRLDVIYITIFNTRGYIYKTKYLLDRFESSDLSLMYIQYSSLTFEFPNIRQTGHGWSICLLWDDDISSIRCGRLIKCDPESLWPPFFDSDLRSEPQLLFVNFFLQLFLITNWQHVLLLWQSSRKTCIRIFTLMYFIF